MRSTLEQLFDRMVSDGWADEQSGDVVAPTGHFALVINRKREREQIHLMFREQVENLALLDPAQYLGSFVVVTDNHGFIYVQKYKHPEQDRSAYRALEQEYARWDTEQEEDSE